MNQAFHRIRQAQIERETSETSIKLVLDLDGSGTISRSYAGPIFRSHADGAVTARGF